MAFVGRMAFAEAIACADRMASMARAIPMACCHMRQLIDTNLDDWHNDAVVLTAAEAQQTASELA